MGRHDGHGLPGRGRVRDRAAAGAPREAVLHRVQGRGCEVRQHLQNILARAQAAGAVDMLDIVDGAVTGVEFGAHDEAYGLRQRQVQVDHLGHRVAPSPGDVAGAAVEVPTRKVTQADHALIFGPVEGLETIRGLTIAHNRRSVWRDCDGHAK